MNKDPLVEIDIVEIAKIAAAIPTPGLATAERIEQAFQLLSFANKIQQEAGAKNISPLSVLAALRDEWNGISVTVTPPEICALMKFGANGETLPIALKDGLKALMPQVDKHSLRIKRFSDYQTSPSGGEWGMGMSCSEAARVTQEYEQAGIPWNEFEGLLIAFSRWWERENIRVKAKAKKGKTKPKEGDATEPAPPDVSLTPKADKPAKPAKGKQGRVIRKNDKRKGSKAGSFLKALKKTS
jgi:hypothetical protein